MSLNIWYLLVLLLLTVFGDCEIFDDCGYRLKLEPDKRLRVVSPNYPDRYPKSTTCRWHITSDTRIRLTCEDFDLPFSPNKCESDVFEVFVSRSLPILRYCDRRFSFGVESDGTEMIMTLRTVDDTPGGSFNCYAEAIEDERSCKCGWKSSPHPRAPIPPKNIILGGAETRVNEYPMMAAIMDTRFVGAGVVCGGTIISKKHVITAAHGLVGFRSGDAAVLVGEHDLTRSNETANAALIFKVAMFHIHPLYKNTKKKYDIAVVLIAGTMTFSNAIGPACLPFNLSPDRFEGSPVEILGWGTTMVSGAISDTLLKARLVAQNFTHCKAHYPEVDTSQMCTYGEDADSCQHDSGGPVLWQHPVTKRLVLIGIISYGTFCGTDKPGVNTFVGAYLDWIRQVTPSIKYCQLY